MEINQSSQQKLIEMVVDNVLKKHDVKTKSMNLDTEEKEKIKGIVFDIQKEVEGFLKNQQKAKTEKDFEQQTDSTPSLEPSQPQPPVRKQFMSNNDVSSVKTFVNKKED
ncbi:hypothetical protein [Alkalihalobacillus sp. LMS39]|uniref:hypothetical protein n=1 Tax=Alkalihalobacillus sp. LMS39 TaxID=2924032 RepID=UPI001FB3DE82|nr:hypothetical protein [Alkalihalobacillus sp. LMS39]UOE93012.1 hypothetical protein MM271_17575 [Alkalihalobacillus sp. LMS39]